MHSFPQEVNRGFPCTTLTQSVGQTSTTMYGKKNHFCYWVSTQNVIWIHRTQFITKLSRLPHTGVDLFPINVLLNFQCAIIPSWAVFMTRQLEFHEDTHCTTYIHEQFLSLSLLRQINCSTGRIIFYCWLSLWYDISWHCFSHHWMTSSTQERKSWTVNKEWAYPWVAPIMVISAHLIGQQAALLTSNWRSDCSRILWIIRRNIHHI